MLVRGKAEPKEGYQKDKKDGEKKRERKDTSNK